jgi:NADH:ubiquinone oxidoreductase subunit C
MINYPGATRFEARHDASWLWVAADSWLDCASWLKAQNFVRCEWLTAAHLAQEQFQVTLCVSDAVSNEKVLVVTQVDEEIGSLEQIYPVVQFHEREVRQMLGLDFINATDRSPAFSAEFTGYPLRRNFALTERTEHEWPGQVDPEKATKRRPALAPGVRQEWL